MLSKSLNAFANAYNFAVSENFAYGKIGKYMVSVCDDGGRKTAFITFYVPEAEGEESETMQRYKLAEDIKALSLPALKDFELCDGGLIIRTGEHLKNFDEAVLAVCGILDDAGFAGAEICSHCGIGIDGENSYVGVDKKHISLLCGDCAKELLESQSYAAIERTYKSKKRGTVAALIADIVFCALFVLLFVFAIPHYGVKDDKGETLVKALFFTIPLSAAMAFVSFMAYRLFTGRKGAERLLPCTGFSAIFSVLLTYFASAAEYAKMCGLSFARTFETAGTSLKAPFTDPFVRDDFLEYLLYAILAVVVVALIYSIALEDKSKPRCVLLKYGDTERFTGFDGRTDEDVAESEAAEDVAESEAAGDVAGSKAAGDVAESEAEGSDGDVPDAEAVPAESSEGSGSDGGQKAED